MTAGEKRKQDSGSISPNDVPDVCTTDRALATARCSPLLHGTLIAHAHVATHVQHRVNRSLVTDNALVARRRLRSPVPHLTGHAG
jgi:hypothetical protein